MFSVKSLMDIVPILTLLGAVQGILLALALIAIKRENKIPNRILSALLFTLSINMVVSLIECGCEEQNLLGISQEYFWFEDALLLVYGPLFFFYIKALISKEFNFKKQTTLHFIPLLASIVYLIPFNPESTLSEEKEYLIAGLGVSHCFIYLALTMKLFGDYSRHVKSSPGIIENVNLKWIRSLMIAFLSVISVYLIFYIEGFTKVSEYFIFLLLSTVIYFIGYMALRQPKIFSSSEKLKSLRKYETSNLTSEKANGYMKKLLDMMITDKPFTNPEITLQTLAKTLSISNHHLSQILNQKLNQNFYEFINAYRIEEAKKQLIDSQNGSRTILEIAFAVGFNSKSAFNDAFKKLTQMTPTQFRKMFMGKDYPVNHTFAKRAQTTPKRYGNMTV